MSLPFKTILLYLLLIGGSFSVNAQFSQVFFHRNQSTLSKKAKNELDQLLEYAKKSKQCRTLTLLGYTDPSASAEHNKKLAYQRTLAVFNYFRERNAPFKYNFVSVGEDDYNAVPSKIKDKEAYMRRVDLRFKRDHFDRTFTDFNFENQVFEINNKRDTTLVGQQGTILKIPAYSFANSKSMNIKIVMKEAYKVSDFIAHKLSSNTTDNQLLESGGMIYIEAFIGKEKVDLNPYKYISVRFRDKKKGDRMNLYYAKQQEDNIVWEDRSTFTQDYVSNNCYFSSSFTRWYDYDDLTDTTFFEREADTLINNKRYLYHRIFIKDKSVNYEELTEMTCEVKEVENYFNSFSLGWLNCDRPIDRKGLQFADLSITVKGSEDIPKTLLYFPSRNAIQVSDRTINGKVSFHDIPQNETAILLSYFSRDGKNVLYAQQKINTSKQEYTLQLESIPSFRLKGKLAALDNTKGI